MITYVKGDLLKSDCDVIAHQANCFRVMGAGIAKQLRVLYPEVVRIDAMDRRDPHQKFGSFTSTTVTHSESGNSLRVYNLYGQLNYGRSRIKPYTDYQALTSALEQMKKDLEVHYTQDTIKALKIGFPRIGAGLAGGDWDVIESRLNQVFRDFNIFVFSL